MQHASSTCTFLLILAALVSHGASAGSCADDYNLVIDDQYSYEACKDETVLTEVYLDSGDTWVTGLGLTDFEFPNLVNVTLHFILWDVPDLASVSVPSLVNCGGKLRVLGPMTNFSAPLLTRVGDGIRLYFDGTSHRLAGDLSFPKLEYVDNEVRIIEVQSDATDYNVSSSYTISFDLLVESGDIFVRSMRGLTSISAPQLKEIHFWKYGHLKIQYNDLLETISFPALEDVFGSLVFMKNDAAREISFPALRSCCVYNPHTSHNSNNADEWNVPTKRYLKISDNALLISANLGGLSEVKSVNLAYNPSLASVTFAEGFHHDSNVSEGITSNTYENPNGCKIFCPSGAAPSSVVLCNDAEGITASNPLQCPQISASSTGGSSSAPSPLGSATQAPSVAPTATPTSSPTEVPMDHNSAGMVYAISVSLVIDHACSGASSAVSQFGEAVRSYLDTSSVHIEANASCGSIALLGRVLYTSAQASANSRYLTLADVIASDPGSFFVPSNGWQLTSADAVDVVSVRDSNPASHHVDHLSVVDPESAMGFSPMLISSTVLALLLLGGMLALLLYFGVLRAGRLRQIRKVAAQNRERLGSVSVIKRRWRSGTMRSDSDSDAMFSPISSSFSSSNLAHNPARRRDSRVQVSIDSQSGEDSVAGSSYSSDSQVSTSSTLSTSTVSAMEPDSIEPGPPLVTPV